MSSLKKLKLAYQRLALNFLIKRQRTERYIKEYRHKVRLSTIRLLAEYSIKHKLKQTLILCGDIALTGLLIKYAVMNRDFIAFGLMAFLAQKYLAWIFEQLKLLKQTKSSKDVERLEVMKMMAKNNNQNEELLRAVKK